MRSTLTRRAGVAVASLALLALAACGGGSGSGGDGDSSLTIAWTSTPSELDPNLYGGNPDVYLGHAHMGTLLAYDIDVDPTRLLFKQHDVTRCAAEYRQLPRQHISGTDIRMPCERNLCRPGEYAHPCRIPGIVGWQDEGRFGIVELGGDALHLRV